MNELEKLHQKLVEDSDSPKVAGELARQLPQWLAPEPTPAETTRLIQALQPALETAVLPASPPLSRHLQWVYWLLVSQMRVVKGEIWVGSTFVILLGTIVTLAMNQGSLPFVLMAPLVAAIGVSFLYGPDVDPAMEIELATAVSPRTILLARLSLLFGIDLLLGLAGSFALSFFLSDVALGPLILGWLAPMTFLSALALFLSLIFSEPLLGILVSLMLWGAQTLHHIPLSLRLPAYIPNLLAAETQPWLWGLAALLVVVTMWLVGQEERMIGKAN